jgi:hypothetical protein
VVIYNVKKWTFYTVEQFWHSWDTWWWLLGAETCFVGKEWYKQLQYWRNYIVYERLLPSSNLPSVDERFHAAGWFSLKVFKVVSSESLGAYHCEANSVIMCINCHIVGTKFSMNHSFWIPKTLITILTADSCVLNFTSLQKLTVSNNRHLHVTGSLPRNVHLTYKEFMLELFYTTSDAIL